MYDLLNYMYKYMYRVPAMITQLLRYMYTCTCKLYAGLVVLCFYMYTVLGTNNMQDQRFCLGLAVIGDCDGRLQNLKINKTMIYIK